MRDEETREATGERGEKKKKSNEAQIRLCKETADGRRAEKVKHVDATASRQEDGGELWRIISGYWRQIKGGMTRAEQLVMRG